MSVHPRATGPADVVITVPFPQALIDRAREHMAPWTVATWVPEQAGPVPEDLWRHAKVLYTHDVLPGPGEAPALGLVQLDTAGSDQLSGTWIWDADVAVTTIAGIAPPATAGYAFAVMLAHAHHLPQLLDYQAKREWPDMATRRKVLTPRLLDRAHLGVVGYGRIGREVGRLGRAFGMTVHGLRRGDPETAAARPDDPDRWWSPADLTGMVAGCDYLVIALPHTRQTDGLIDAEVVAAIKPGAFVVNVGRGGVVDEDALLARLRREELGGAAFDVFATEPLETDSPWWDAPGVLVSPHVAGFNPRYEEEAVALLCDNVRRLRDGRELSNRLDRGRGY